MLKEKEAFINDRKKRRLYDKLPSVNSVDTVVVVVVVVTVVVENVVAVVATTFVQL